MEQYNYIHSHDGAGDDQLALILMINILSSVNKKLLATVLTPSDSYLEPALNTTSKIVYNFSKETLIIVSDIITPNSFPKCWKDDSYKIDEIVDLECNKEKLNISTDIAELVKIIKSSDKKIIIYETGPLTTLAKCLSTDPGIQDYISEIIWMGGCFDNSVSKSLPRTVDGTQSWNSYIDPIAADIVWKSKIKLTLFTREITEKFKITSYFLNNLPNSVCGNIFKNVYNMYKDDYFYRLWDVGTISYITLFDKYQHKYINSKIITSGKSQGKTLELNNDEKLVKKVKVVTDIDDLLLLYNTIIQYL